MEKRIIIGRGTDCDVTIPDETDNVSRHHLVISFNFFGKMKISDTSSNGTFINENRMLKGSSVPVTRNDNIRLGASWQLDWSLVNDPFKNTRKAVIACLVFVVLILAGVGVYSVVHTDTNDSPNIIIPKADTTATDNNWNGDSTLREVPVEQRIDVGNAARKSVQPQKAKTKKQSGRTKKQGRKDINKPSDRGVKEKDLSKEKNITIVN